MRRRIYISPYGSGLEDVTNKPSQYREDCGSPLGALYNDPLWEAYVAAKHALSRLEGAVIANLCGEPYDEIELAAATEARAIFNNLYNFDMPKLRLLGERVVKHATELYGNGDAPKYHNEIE